MSSRWRTRRARLTRARLSPGFYRYLKSDAGLIVDVRVAHRLVRVLVSKALPARPSIGSVGAF